MLRASEYLSIWSFIQNLALLFITPLDRSADRM